MQGAKSQESRNMRSEKQTREGAKITKPVTGTDVVDYSFLDRAGKELGIKNIL